MSLKEYQRKRDFQRTPEPAGTNGTSTRHVFVVQKHAARRLHYDFRLELDNTLKSWAVPKGPSLDPSVKSLAVHVEDHPLEYATFEGVIPKDQYGGGTVMVWDHGTWEPEGDARKQYRKGKLKFRLYGEKLTGAWSLVQMSGKAGDDGKNWLLIKRDDRDAQRESHILEDRPLSAISGRSLTEIATDADRVWQSNGTAEKSSTEKQARRKSASRNKSQKKEAASSVPVLTGKQLANVKGAQKGSIPTSFKPQLATLSSSVPQGDDWLHELKFDGYRLLAFIDNGEVRLVTRNGNDWTDRFRTIATDLQNLPLMQGLLDGEIVSINKAGISDFQQLQNQMKRGRDEDLVYYLFDAPYLEGYNLARTRLDKRKALLARLVLAVNPSNDGPIRYSDHIRGQGPDVFEHACRFAMEGVVSKQAKSTYHQARTKSWLKTKCIKRQEFVIGGYTKPGGSRVGFGALVLGYYQDGQFIYAGRVGTGFNHESLRRIKAELTKRKTDSSPFTKPPQGSQARGVQWVKPELVGEVEFTEWTSEGLLRHPSFQGLREDKTAENIVREVAENIPSKGKAMYKSRNPQASTAVSHGRQEPGNVAGVQLTHPDRILYPDQGVTKQQLAEYYESVADHILPHVANRPLSLVRCPRGSTGKCFYQKHWTETLPEAVHRISIEEKDKKADYVYIEDLAGLVSLVQIGVLEIHPWQSLVDDVERADLIVIDLDPDPSLAWDRVVEAARDVRDQIAGQNMDCFVRTSGSKGLHVVIPLKSRLSWEDAKFFAKSIATPLAQDYPDRYLAVSTKAKRKGKVFIDYLRNSRGATAIACFSTRARPAAPIAVPLRWDELSRVDSSDHYTVANIQRRLSALKQDPWEGYFNGT